MDSRQSPDRLLLGLSKVQRSPRAPSRMALCLEGLAQVEAFRNWVCRQFCGVDIRRRIRHVLRLALSYLSIQKFGQLSWQCVLLQGVEGCCGTSQ